MVTTIAEPSEDFLRCVPEVSERSATVVSMSSSAADKATDETTERIRSAALSLFVERGYGNTTIDHISTAAGVGVATIYRRWPDKAAIANDLFAAAVSSMRDLMVDPVEGSNREQFGELWNRVWTWASANSESFLFVNASGDAPWLSKANVALKASVTELELATFTRLELDAAPDFVATLIIGTIGSVLSAAPDIEPAEVGERLWRALALPVDPA